MLGGHIPQHGHAAAPDAPPAWICAGSAPSDYVMGVDHRIAHTGKGSGFLRSRGSRPAGFGALMQTVDAERYHGRRMRLRAWVKTRGVKEWAGVWMRVESRDPDRPLAADFMQARPIQGTTDWTPYDVVLDVAPEATRIALGLLLDGRGWAWIDDIGFEEVDASVPTTGGSDALVTSPSPWNLNFEK